MKVSLVVSDLSSSGVGRWGGAVRPFLLSQALKKLQVDVEIVGFISGEKQQLATNQENSIIAIDSHNYYPKFLLSAKKLLDQITGDIIYAYKLKPTSLGLSLIRKMQTHRPVFLDIDDWELPCLLWRRNFLSILNKRDGLVVVMLLLVSKYLWLIVSDWDDISSYLLHASLTPNRQYLKILGDGFAFF
ncbi:MAG: hypothetical protein F6K48_22360 [Okeania sp. SIO3H1]|nr:hypothetical protein [Okeania sp. SIO3H1]